MDASASVTGQRGRAPGDVEANLEGPSRNQKKRRRFDGLCLALLADKEVAREHPNRRNPELRSRADATRTFVVEGVGGAKSAWVAEECNRILGKELEGEEVKLYADLARGAKERELSDWQQSKVLRPLREAVTPNLAWAPGRRSPGRWRVVRKV